VLGNVLVGMVTLPWNVRTLFVCIVALLAGNTFALVALLGDERPSGATGAAVVAGAAGEAAQRRPVAVITNADGTTQVVDPTTPEGRAAIEAARQRGDSVETVEVQVAPDGTPIAPASGALSDELTSEIVDVLRQNPLPTVPGGATTTLPRGAGGSSTTAPGGGQQPGDDDDDLLSPVTSLLEEAEDLLDDTISTVTSVVTTVVGRVEDAVDEGDDVVDEVVEDVEDVVEDVTDGDTEVTVPDEDDVEEIVDEVDDVVDEVDDVVNDLAEELDVSPPTTRPSGSGGGGLGGLLP